LHCSTPVDYALRPPRQPSDDLDTAAGHTCRIPRPKMRDGLSAGWVDHTKEQCVSDEFELDLDLVALPTPVADRVGDKLACDEQRVSDSLRLGRRASEDVLDEAPRLTDGLCFGGEPGANLTWIVDLARHLYAEHPRPGDRYGCWGLQSPLRTGRDL
jgi:hypothetical protein